MSAPKQPVDITTARQVARRGEKQAAVLNQANLQQLRELLWITLQNDPDLKQVRSLVSCLLDTRKLIEMDGQPGEFEEFGPGEQEGAVFRNFRDLPEPDCSAVALLQQDITAASAAAP